MSETITPAAAPLKPPAPLLSAQLIIALYGMTILAGALAAVFLIKDLSPLQGSIAGATVSGIIGAVTGFYFGSSQGSQSKDALIAGKATPVAGS